MVDNNELIPQVVTDKHRKNPTCTADKQNHILAFNSQDSQNIENKHTGRIDYFSNTVNQILNNALTKQIKAVVIHGPSASGKTTFAKNLYDCLTNRTECYIIHLDNYFRTVAGEDYTKYDFDNPAVYNWENVTNLLTAINNGDEYLPTYKYCFIKRESQGPFYIRNNFPKVVIIEGCYAMNISNQEVFDVEKFDPTDSSKEGFKKRTTCYKNISFLNIKMIVCREKLRQLKIQRDFLERNHTKEEAAFMFDKQSWPAAIKWVFSKRFQSHINIIHGTFNKHKYETLFKLIVSFLIAETQKEKQVAFEKSLCKPQDLLFLDKKTSQIECGQCSFECQLEQPSQIVIEDSAH
ncbi:Armadillo/beta-Catenin/plakoglobin [Pseudoloma neurophilia]|uniref:Armadillo/beta-Catenin/plakoglobin n=1 Tax=Pseudoloma neurophilia TaxID=146866 RepID=A0A0R0M6E9_9MICR|nr:Armadillo/beta-Catenin/plakoglobin [Pseudoloma neurophilia]